MSSFNTAPVTLTVLLFVALCSAFPTNTNQGIVSNTGSVMNSISMAATSPEASVVGSNMNNNQMSQLNMGGINELVANAVKGMLSPQSAGGAAGESPMTSLLGSLLSSTGNGASLLNNLGGLASSMVGMQRPRMPMNPMSMMFPRGGASPFGMMMNPGSLMNTGMMMNMMDNMFEMFSF